MSSIDILLSVKDTDLIVKKCSVDDRLIVRYKDVGVKEGKKYALYSGYGKTFEESCDDYLSKIKGRTLIFLNSASAREVVLFPYEEVEDDNT